MKQLAHKLIWAMVILTQIFLWSDFAFGNDQDDDYINVKVPHRLRAQGYSLRIEDREINLNRPILRLLPTGRTHNYQLVAADKRIVDQNHGPISARMLRKMEPQRHRVGIMGGNSFVDRGSFAGLLLPRKLSAVDLRYEYNAGSFIGLISLAGMSHEETITDGPKVDYDADGVRLGGGKEFAPFHGQGTSPFLSRLHFQANAGLTVIGHRVEYSDAYNSITHKGTSVGGFVEAQVRCLLVANFWLSMRVAGDFYNVAFEDLDFEKNIFQTTTLWGVDYVF